MKHIKLFFLMVLFLASCTTSKIPEPTQTSTPKPTATQTLIPTTTPTITPAPTQIGGGTGKLIFNYIRTGGYEKSFPEVEGEVNIFTANWDGTDLTPITNGLNGANLFAGVSPDGRKILVSSFKPGSDGDGDLYVVYLDGGLEPQKIASGLDGNLLNADGGRHAIWLNNDTISFIAKDEKTSNNRVFIVKSDGTGLKRISENVKDQNGVIHPVEILPTKDATHVYWNGCSYKGLYPFCKIWWSNIDGSGQSVLHLEPQDNVISPDGSMVVWNKPVHRAVGDCCAIYVSSVSETDKPRSTLENEGNGFQVVWFPDSSEVLLFRPTSKFSTNTYPYAAYILSPTDLTYKQIDLPISKEVVTDIHLRNLSPDGRLLLFKEGSATKIINIETMTLSEEFTKHITQDVALGEQTYSLIEWLPVVK